MSLLDHPEARALLADAEISPPSNVRGCRDHITHFLKRYLPANRQLIVELFPTAHRRASRFPDRPVIDEVHGGTGTPSRSPAYYPATCGA
jgi:hypothetical protein